MASCSLCLLILPSSCSKTLAFFLPSSPSDHSCLSGAPERRGSVHGRNPHSAKPILSQSLSLAPLRFVESLSFRFLPKLVRLSSGGRIADVRHWSDACSRLLVSSFLMVSTIFSDPLIAGAFTERSVRTAPYPCEDVGIYYRKVDSLRGAALMKKLHSIVSPHRSLPYKAVWDALKILDAAEIDNPEASLDIVEIYSLRSVSKSLAGKPDGWNREHLWPRSYGLTDGASLTDLHNIRPADVNVNSSRGNKNYGECLNLAARCKRPANSEAAPETETDKERWAPPYQVKGDIARSVMYMAISYGFQQSYEKPHLQLSDTPSIEKTEMGLLSTLLEWNELDPPSRAEHLRNDRICKLYQHNRNPFIDHPDYANLIWKSKPAGSNPATAVTTSPKIPLLKSFLQPKMQRP